MKGKNYVVKVRYETEDGRRLEVTSKRMTNPAAQKLAAVYNRGYHTFTPGRSYWRTVDDREKLPAHVTWAVMSEVYTVREIEEK